MELVTGGGGFIGSHLVDALVEQGNEVRVIDNFSSGREEFLSHHDGNGSVEVHRGDLLDQGAVIAAMEGVETVHHLAANPDIRLGIEVTDTDLRQGTMATYNVLEAMRIAEVRRISFASSSAVYGEADVMPTPEDYGPVMPISLYGASKLAGEALITAWAGTFGAQGFIHRFANIVGPRGTHGVIFDFIHKLKRDPARLEVLGDGNQEKSYMSAHDCVQSMIHVIGLGGDGPVLNNLGTGDTCSVSRIAEIVIEESGFEDVSIDFTGGERGWAGDVPKTYLDVTKLLDTGFEPTTMSEQAVRDTARVLISEIGL
ncbi:MAG TPA: NAD-dependent epimerase/dehydratase family protein [Candidatus Poseidoniales archaeon]|jgi:UDP-glucose 4-epimerase|nr:MAG: UDP-glucose 4-epimerase [Euryarchaeota archaeon]HIG34254.1 NAD-dependent epimerase/dehydratase family protein [Candidatus Poseidoniales archaeon]HIL67898.1 NAD-dependent epimerase/dehydratase family protein [Candidatus Poseidoniales archaeon]